MGFPHYVSPGYRMESEQHYDRVCPHITRYKSGQEGMQENAWPPILYLPRGGNNNEFDSVSSLVLLTEIRPSDAFYFLCI